VQLMRDILVSLMLTCLLVSCVSVATEAYWKDVCLVNGGFETTVKDSHIPGWPDLIGVAEGRGGIVVNGENVHGGISSLRMADEDQNAAVEVRSERIEVIPGAFYMASAHVYIESGTSARLYLDFWDARNRRLASHTARTEEVERWHPLLVQAYAPEETRSLTIRLVSTGANVGVLYWDDVGLSRFDEDDIDHEVRPTMGWAPQFQTDLVLPTRLPVKVDWADNDRLQNSPVTFGVPFPNGALRDIDQLRLVTAKGDSVPLQSEVTATWDSKDGPVRWALLHANLRRDEEYFLEIKESAEASFEGLRIEETEQAFLIDTGPMQAVVSKIEPTVLHQVALDLSGDGLFSPDDIVLTSAMAMEDLPVVMDGEGNEYMARGAGEGFKAEIVRSGPMEVAIRREGWYTGKDGTPFSQFVTYTHFFAGETIVRHDHTLITAFDSTKHRIRDIRLSIPLLLGDDAQASFATDRSADGNSIFLAPGISPRMVQREHNHWTLTSHEETVVAEADRAGGWCGLGDDRWGVLAGWRDFWEQHPAELEIKDNTLHLHLWPLHDVDLLDFNPSSLMGIDYPHDRIFYQDFYKDGLDGWTQAYGLAKTHNVWIGFYTADRHAHTAALTRSLVNQPVLAQTAPEWNTATEVMGRIHYEDPDNHSEIEALLEAIIHRKQWLRERLDNYGWIDYGDVNYNLRNHNDPESISPVLWRKWASMFYGWPNAAPLLYFRSGRRDVWDMHRTNTRHITDVDIAHLDHQQFAKRKGGRYGGNGGIVHYAANMYDLGPDTHLRFMLYDYYMNGTLRVWEVAKYYMDNYLSLAFAPQNQSYAHRATGGSLRLFCEAYEATWKPEYLEAMRHFARIMYGAREVLGSTRYDDVYMNEGKIKYYQLTGDERMLDLFLNDMRELSKRRDAHVFEDPRHTTMAGLAHAYWFTGDESFLDFLFWQLKVALGPGEDSKKHMIPTGGDPGLVGATGEVFEHAYHATLGNQLPTVVKLLEDLDTPISYLLSEPACSAFGKDVTVIHAPEGFTPPPLHTPVRVFFEVPEEGLYPAVYVDTPVRIFDAAGRPVNEGRETMGWIDLSAGPKGLWSLEPVSAISGCQLKVHNLPPVFALERADRFEMPKIRWLEWPFAMPRGGLPKERLPLDVRLHGDDEIDSIRILVDDRLLYEGDRPPQGLGLSVSELTFGSHRIEVRVRRGSMEQRYSHDFDVVHVDLLSPSPSRGERVRGIVPLVLETMVSPEEVRGFAVRLVPVQRAEVGEPIVVYKSSGVPGVLPFNTADFADGTYDLEISMTTSSGNSTLHKFRIVIDNWDILEDTILPPTQSGWFGGFDRLLAVDRSEGWEYTDESPDAFFGDRQRIRLKKGAGEGYLTWQLSRLKEFAFTVYARGADAARLVDIAVSDDGTVWHSLPYTVDSEGRSAEGWLNLTLKGEVHSAGTDYVRLTVKEGGLPDDTVELGYVYLKALKYLP
jgi:hypothetical protein